jgi:hypothetical protein
MDSSGTQLEIFDFSRNDTPASAAHTAPGHAPSAPLPLQQRSQDEPVGSRLGPFGDVHILGQRARQPHLPIGQRICILSFFLVGIASLIVLFVDQYESMADDVVAKTALYSRSGATSAKSFASADVRSTDGANRVPASLGEMLTASERPPPIPPAGDPPLATDAAPIPVLESAATTSGPAVNPLTPAIPSAGGSPLATQVAPIGVLRSAAPTLAPAVNQPTAAIPPAGDPPLATHAAPIDVPPSAAPTPGNAAVLLDDDAIVRLIKRGRDFLKEGDFAAARLLFERAADAGSAEGALALGSTYDPAVIKQLGAVSVAPDLDRARKWYATAADRGSAEAADRYANLNRAR